MSQDWPLLPRRTDHQSLERSCSGPEELGLASVAVVLKERRGGRQVDVGGLVGDAIPGPALIVDDMITTGRTVDAAASAITDRWSPTSLMVAATHALFVEDAAERIAKHSPSLVAVSDTVTTTDLPDSCRVSTVAALLAETITEMHRRW